MPVALTIEAFRVQLSFSCEKQTRVMSTLLPKCRDALSAKLLAFVIATNLHKKEAVIALAWLSLLCGELAAGKISENFTIKSACEGYKIRRIDFQF